MKCLFIKKKEKRNNKINKESRNNKKKERNGRISSLKKLNLVPRVNDISRKEAVDEGVPTSGHPVPKILVPGKLPSLDPTFTV